MKKLKPVSHLENSLFSSNCTRLNEFCYINKRDVIPCSLYKFVARSRVQDTINQIVPPLKADIGTVSIARNSIIASMLYRIKYIEQIGTGILRMKNAAREAEVEEPEFELFGFFKVTFRRSAAPRLVAAGGIGGGEGFIVPAGDTINDGDTINGTISGTINDDDTVNGTISGTINGDDTVNGTASGTINGDDTISFDDDDSRLLKVISDNPEITYNELAAMLSIPRRTISRKMQRLQGNGKIEREGARKNGRWKVRL